MVIPHTKEANVSYRMDFELMESFALVLVMFISATAALFFKMYSFGMTLVIKPF